MWLMIVPGVISVVFGVIFLCAPQRLMRERPTQQRPIIPTDELFLNHRISTGICLIAVGVFCLLSAFYVWLRPHS